MNIDIQDIQYELCDDGGLNSIWLPIILPVKTQFHHEFGTYTVEEHFKRDDGKRDDCVYPPYFEDDD